MRLTNAFTGKTFGSATPQQKTRERRRRVLTSVLSDFLAPLIAVVRPIINLAKGSAQAIGRAGSILWQVLGRVLALIANIARAAKRSIDPITGFLSGSIKWFGTSLKPIAVGVSLAPKQAAAESRQFASALGAIGREIARLRSLGAQNAKRLAIATRGDISAAAASLGRRLLADFLAVKTKAIGLAERTGLFLSETGATIRQGGKVLWRTLKAAGRAATVGLAGGLLHLGRGFLEIWTAPLNLARRFGRWLPEALATIAGNAKSAGVTVWRFSGNILRAIASVLLIAGFAILFVVTLLSRGIWSLVGASAMASIWVALIAARITWWTLRSIGLASAYVAVQLGRLVGAVLRSALRSLGAAYAAMPRVIRFVLEPSVAVLKAARELLIWIAGAIAIAAKSVAAACRRYGMALAQASRQAWWRLRAIRLPHFRLRQKGEEALAYAAVASLSFALLIYSGLTDPLPPIPPPAAETRIAEAPAEVAPEPRPAPQVEAVQRLETPAPEVKEAQPAEPKVALAKPPVVEIPTPQTLPRARPQGSAKIAIVIDDMGMKRGMTRPFAELPGRLTFAFLPYAGDLRRQTRHIREAGHELFVHLPMEPESRVEDPGPNALLTRLSIEEIAGRVKWNLNRFDGFAGINNHMGSLFTKDRNLMRPVMEAIQSRHLVYLDSRTSAAGVGPELAEELGIPWVSRDIFLDNVRTRAAIDEQLARTVRLAQRRGQAVAIGHNYQVTLDALRAWLPEIQAAGIELVTISELVHDLPKDPETHRTAAAGAGQK